MERTEMKLESTSIKEAIADIETGRICLPPFQKKIAWNYDHAINLFDSLYHNYPMVPCLFWRLKPETSQNYPLCKFQKEYSENKRERITNENVPDNVLEKDVYAVVDGQQRLSCLFIGLAGTYKYNKSGKSSRDADEKFVTSKLYINLLATAIKVRQEVVLFKFLEENDIIIIDKNLWFEVSNILTWKSPRQAATIVNEILQPRIIALKKKMLNTRFEMSKDNIVAMLKALYKMLNDKRIYYLTIDDKNLDEVIDIFNRIRIVDGPIKKSDLVKYAPLSGHYS